MHYRCANPAVILDLTLKKEVVNCESDPAEYEDEDGHEDLSYDSELAVLEDIENAPDGDDDTEDVDDLC